MTTPPAIPSPAVRFSPVAGPYTAVVCADLHSAPASERDWLWDGYLRPGEITLLTSQWKSGKSTVVAVLLARMQTGGELAGRAVRAGKVVIVSEEDAALWHERSTALGLGAPICLFCRPFLGKPREQDWLGLLDQIGRMHEQYGVDLLVIDSLANLAPLRSENEAGEMLRALLPLQRLTTRGMAVLVLHHPRKGTLVPGQAARGSGALSGFVDIIIEMQRLGAGHPSDRRRRLRAYSRHHATPPV